MDGRVNGSWRCAHQCAVGSPNPIWCRRTRICTEMDEIKLMSLFSMGDIRNDEHRMQYSRIAEMQPRAQTPNVVQSLTHIHTHAAKHQPKNFEMLFFFQTKIQRRKTDDLSLWRYAHDRRIFRGQHVLIGVWHAPNGFNEWCERCIARDWAILTNLKTGALFVRRSCSSAHLLRETGVDVPRRAVVLYVSLFSICFVLHSFKIICFIFFFLSGKKSLWFGAWNLNLLEFIGILYVFIFGHFDTARWEIIQLNIKIKANQRKMSTGSQQVRENCVMCACAGDDWRVFFFFFWRFVDSVFHRLYSVFALTFPFSLFFWSFFWSPFRCVPSPRNWQFGKREKSRMKWENRVHF